MLFYVAAIILAFTSRTNAQFGFGGYGGGGSPNSPFGGGNSGFDPFSFLSTGTKILTAHAVLASLAFVIFFPTGGILIRLCSFRGLWLVHGLFQIFAYLLYIAAFGLGIWMATNFRMLNQAHPIIGIVLFVLLFFQPLLGFLHHFMFKRHGRRMVWSYGHIWLGRVIITLGIINGGLGLQLAKRTRVGAPSNGRVVAYSVVAAIMWVVYVLAALLGEIRRRRALARGAPARKEEGDVDQNAYVETGWSHNRQPLGSRYN
ncbi:hypothetical protein AOQ84DRAFT_388179 [Glonium stellatum]|uniref:Cytochrome b561 domain-containing protein n=1 Tax=Glonium stellatum TaxID=574774 RepID=A0A8E2JTW9_9PEZI|nr:hypothetical protein AOQ84DRAFT_388179 [Glonium stellatum]